MVCGVYKISFSNTDKVYIGSSKDIDKRIKQHKAMLEADCHHSYKLQEYYNKHSDLICYEVVEECDEHLRTNVEAYFINKYNAIYNGFNVAQVQPIFNQEMNEISSIVHMPTILPVYSKFLCCEYSTIIAIVASYMKFNYDLCTKNGLKYCESHESISNATNISVSAVKSAIKKLKDSGIVITSKEGSLYNINYYEVKV